MAEPRQQFAGLAGLQKCHEPRDLRHSADRATRCTGCATASIAGRRAPRRVGGVAIQRERRQPSPLGAHLAERHRAERACQPFQRIGVVLVGRHRQQTGAFQRDSHGLRHVGREAPQHRPIGVRGFPPDQPDRRAVRPCQHAARQDCRNLRQRDPGDGDVRMCDERDWRPGVGGAAKPLGELRIVQRASREGKIDRAGRHGREAPSGAEAGQHLHRCRRVRRREVVGDLAHGGQRHAGASDAQQDLATCRARRAPCVAAVPQHDRTTRAAEADDSAGWSSMDYGSQGQAGMCCAGILNGR